MASVTLGVPAVFYSSCATLPVLVRALPRIMSLLHELWMRNRLNVRACEGVLLPEQKKETGRAPGLEGCVYGGWYPCGPGDPHKYLSVEGHPPEYVPKNWFTQREVAIEATHTLLPPSVKDRMPPGPVG